MDEIRISLQPFTGEEIETIKNNIDAIKAILAAKCVTLKKDQREHLHHMGTRSVDFIGHSIAYCDSNPTLVPNYLDLANLKVDWKIYLEAREISDLLLPINQFLTDTMSAAGASSYAGARIFYEATKTGMKANVPGSKLIYKELKKRFPHTRKKVDDSTTTEES